MEYKAYFVTKENATAQKLRQTANLRDRKKTDESSIPYVADFLAQQNAPVRARENVRTKLEKV